MKQAKQQRWPRKPAITFELSIDIRTTRHGLPTQAQLHQWAYAALQNTVEHAQISLLIVDAEEGRTLNHDYRGKDYATNVLSFALNEGEAVAGMPLFGDLVICAPVVEKEAQDQGISLLAHYAHLVIHGMLHLQGHDHEEDDEADVMETLETNILKKLGYPDPYLEEKL